MQNTKAPEGMAAGVVVGDIFGWLARIGLLTIPRLAMFVAGGPIVAMFKRLRRRAGWSRGRAD